MATGPPNGVRSNRAWGEGCAPFMYMGWLELDGRRLHHYKHQISRRYLFVDDALETYRYAGGSVYVPQARKDAIRYALEEPGQRRR